MALKLYLVSLMAITTVEESNADTSAVAATWVDVRHEPTVVWSDSIEDAAQQAREQAFQYWPRAHGWKNQSATITPVGSQYMDFLKRMVEQSEIEPDDTSLEAVGHFEFDETPASFHLSTNRKGH